MLFPNVKCFILDVGGVVVVVDDDCCCCSRVSLRVKGAVVAKSYEAQCLSIISTHWKVKRREKIVYASTTKQKKKNNKKGLLFNPYLNREQKRR